MLSLTPACPRSDRAGRRTLAPQVLVLILVLIVLAAAASACSSYGPSPTATPAPKPAEPTKAAGPTTAPAPAAVTAGSLADAGKTVFANRCAGCHGANGQGANGPANIGSGNQLAKYATGKGLYDKVSTTMPKSAPGTLTAAEYMQVTAFLLVQNNFVKATDPLDASKLAAIAIK
ncbi:MAG: cytochrome c [Chloroflexota bacterium]|nr:cytochrome c [Chloroflexota bacterium]